MKLTLLAVPCRCRLGVPLQERRRPQRVLLDLELDPKMGASVDYLKVYREARSLAEGREWVLVEDLAEALAGRLLAGFPGLAGLTVRVRKRPAVMPGVEVVVEHASARLGRAARREGR